MGESQRLQDCGEASSLSATRRVRGQGQTSRRTCPQCCEYLKNNEKSLESFKQERTSILAFLEGLVYFVYFFFSLLQSGS